MPDMEKAIRGLEYCSEKFCSLHCPYYSCDACVSALHKDIFELLKPKMPKVENEHKIDSLYSSVNAGNCPNCGMDLSDNINENYCGRCGQKIEWSSKHERN